jgi:two-component system, NtrC family, nitrogen regulation sensor histidine kinase NtrY
MKQNISLYILVAAIVALATAEFRERLIIPDTDRLAASTERNLHKLEDKLNQSLNEISLFTSENQLNEYYVHHDLHDEGFAFFHYDKGRLTNWTDNETQLPDSIITGNYNNKLIHLTDGWFEISSKTIANNHWIGLLLIRKEFPFENKYLSNHFNQELGLPDNARLDTTGSANPIKSISGNNLFSFILTQNDEEAIIFSLNGWLELLAFIFFLFSVLIFFIQRKEIQLLSLIFIAIILFTVRWIMIWFRFPNEFYTSEFFSPKYYGSSFFFNSVGDLLLNALSLFVFASLVLMYAKSNPIKRYNISNGLAVGLLTCTIIFILLIHNLISSLIINSKISYEVEDLFGLEVYNLSAIASMMLLLWSSFLICYSFLNLIRISVQKRTLFFLFLIIALSLVSALSFIIQSFQLPGILFSAVLILSLSHIINRKLTFITNIGIGFVFLFTVYAAYVIHHNQTSKEREERKLFAQKLDSRQDHLAEYLFEDEASKITMDSTIQRIFRQGGPKVNAAINRRLHQLYFQGYLNKFDIAAFCFDKNGTALESNLYSLDYFRKKIQTEGRKTYSDKIYFLIYESGGLNYRPKLSC